MPSLWLDLGGGCGARGETPKGGVDLTKIYPALIRCQALFFNNPEIDIIVPMVKHRRGAPWPKSQGWEVVERDLEPGPVGLQTTLPEHRAPTPNVLSPTSRLGPSKPVRGRAQPLAPRRLGAPAPGFQSCQGLETPRSGKCRCTSEQRSWDKDRGQRTEMQSAGGHQARLRLLTLRAKGRGKSGGTPDRGRGFDPGSDWLAEDQPLQLSGCVKSRSSC